ncbi:MAG: hypothetical protein RQ847_09830 [Wenzhouxiangellaceae bacterium]|nr:hypothetical protein [Wenzhouxiangellaceae bacterium]
MRNLTPALALLACLSAPAAAVEFELTQDPEAVLEHQRMPGNARAQAERRGVIRSVPHLFVYHPDRSPAFHMQGLRRGFERQLSMMLDDFRVQRSMVPLEVLLSRAKNSDGERVALEDLPVRRVAIVIYRREDCPECDAVEQALDDFLAGRDDLDPVRIRITLR